MVVRSKKEDMAAEESAVNTVSRTKHAASILATKKQGIKTWTSNQRYKTTKSIFYNSIYIYEKFNTQLRYILKDIGNKK